MEKKRINDSDVENNILMETIRKHHREQDEEDGKGEEEE